MRTAFYSQALGRHSLARLVLPCSLLLATLLTGAVIAHPASLSGSGTRLFWSDIALLTAYAIAAICIATHTRETRESTFHIATKLGLLLASVLIANDLVELFVPHRPFALIIAPVFLAIAILAAAGSAAWAATRSTILAILAGVCCILIAVPLFLFVAVCLHLVLSSRAELPLQQPFAASGMTDPASFLVQNILQSASEGLLRFPAFAVFLSLAGVVSAWVSSVSSRARLTIAWLAPLLFAAGALALKHANTLPREERPPFVMAGVALAVAALASVQTLWSTLHRA